MRALAIIFALAGGLFISIQVARLVSDLTTTLATAAEGR